MPTTDSTNYTLHQVNALAIFNGSPTALYVSDFDPGTGISKIYRFDPGSGWLTRPRRPGVRGGLSQPPGWSFAALLIELIDECRFGL